MSQILWKRWPPYVDAVEYIIIEWSRAIQWCSLVVDSTEKRRLLSKDRKLLLPNMFLQTSCFRKSAFEALYLVHAESFMTRHGGSPTIHSIARRIKSAQYSGSLTQRPSNSITRRIAYRDGEAARRSPSISNSNGEQGHDGLGI